MRCLAHLLVFLLGSTRPCLKLLLPRTTSSGNHPTGNSLKTSEPASPKRCCRPCEFRITRSSWERPPWKTSPSFSGTMDSKGDAAEFYQWLCFRGGNQPDRWALWLVSGEIDGGNVGSFEWRRIPARAVIDKRCVRLNEEPQLPLALKLGNFCCGSSATPRSAIMAVS